MQHSRVGRLALATLRTGLVWGAAWLPFAIGFTLYRAAHLTWRAPVLDLLSVIGILTLWGAVSGVLYALILRAAGRHHSLATLSTIRVAGWGALGSATLPTILMFLLAASLGFYEGWLRELITAILMSGALGASCAASTLILARRAGLEVHQ